MGQRRKVPQVTEMDVVWLLLDVASDPAKAATLLAARPEVVALAQALVVEQDLGLMATIAGDWDVAAATIWPDVCPGNRRGGLDAIT